MTDTPSKLPERVRGEVAGLIDKVLKENEKTFTALATEPNWDEIAEYAQGTSNSIYQIAATFDIPDDRVDEMEAKIEERGHVMCASCGWWNEDSEMYDGDHCNECHDENEEDD
jgi:hypothetical protein